MKAALDHVEYDPTVVEITRVGISGVVGRELGRNGWKTLHSSPESEGGVRATVAVSDDAARDAVKSGLLSNAEELTVQAGYAAAFKDRVYGALVHHVRSKFLNGWAGYQVSLQGSSNMAISKRGDFWNPQKCPWNFEKFQSDLERRMMLRLENDPHVRKWMKRHGL